jgi:hypothetical protein
MEDLTIGRYQNDPRLRAEMKAAAHRERARVVKRFLEQSAHALLGPRSNARPAPRMTPCEAC